jgi:hypothetical protein
MTTRPTRISLPFNRPLRLKGIDTDIAGAAAGTGTEPQPADGAVRAAEEQMATFVHIHRDGSAQVVTVNAADLEMLFHEGVLMPLDAVDPGVVSGSMRRRGS